jgi:hypothetical protein
MAATSGVTINSSASDYAWMVGTITAFPIKDVVSASTSRTAFSVTTQEDDKIAIRTTVFASGKPEVAMVIIPRVLYEDDPEIVAMTDEELAEAAAALFGSWAERDDIDDDWLDNLRSGWDERLKELYGPDFFGPDENLPVR